MTDYLLANGIPANRILPHTNSANTIQDGICAHKIVADLEVSQIVVVTSDFHMQRVKFIFGQLFAGTNVDYLNAPNQVDSPTLDKLLEHETHALRRLQENWEQLFQQNSQIGERPFPDKK